MKNAPLKLPEVRWLDPARADTGPGPPSAPGPLHPHPCSPATPRTGPGRICSSSPRPSNRPAAAAPASRSPARPEPRSPPPTAPAGHRSSWANGAEGEPASVKDKMLLARVPHLVLDGACLAAAAFDAEEIVGVAAGSPGEISVPAALAERELPCPARTISLPERFVSGESGALIRWHQRSAGDTGAAEGPRGHAQRAGCTAAQRGSRTPRPGPNSPSQPTRTRRLHRRRHRRRTRHDPAHRQPTRHRSARRRSS